MTYGGSVAADHAAYAGFVNGDTASSLTTAAHVLDDGHQRQHGRRLAIPDVLQRRGGLELHHRP